ncbi:hypothetical protein [Saccharothrix obliqua]|uniref:hypothetical protein n=1 Tax=Saccharothrix obliqua TaxID=2861747 RepID=UPI001C5F613F|nr:hypothetical protein [Saccharothrix obliqua]MBW4718133.1 hypothetical protein [Saccharothrix obliqua]
MFAVPAIRLPARNESSVSVEDWSSETTRSGVLSKAKFRPQLVISMRFPVGAGSVARRVPEHAEMSSAITKVVAVQEVLR